MLIDPATLPLAILGSVWELVESVWIEALIVLIFAFFGSWLGSWRARRQWRSREFYNLLNISLNSIRDGKLMIRTIMEDEIDEVFINKAAADKVKECAKLTTAEDPFLPIPQEDIWFVHNEVLNDVSQMFSNGHIKADMDMPVRTNWYVIGLTCERAGKMRTYKVRAMMIRRDTLEYMPKDRPELEHDTHSTRWETLQIMAKHYKENPARFIEIELSQ